MIRYLVLDTAIKKEHEHSTPLRVGAVNTGNSGTRSGGYTGYGTPSGKLLRPAPIDWQTIYAQSTGTKNALRTAYTRSMRRHMMTQLLTPLGGFGGGQGNSGGLKYGASPYYPATPDYYSQHRQHQQPYWPTTAHPPTTRRPLATTASTISSSHTGPLPSSKKAAY
ncbi:Uu.00g053000.m01.CDS01 [Anthostomella pinea]|uniref:Uu.00g053000.m01.CDS01 n=1 Tax=Anthostomella pinea TaxID=933095 RepID=A0AAI8VX97_9PEZI|nr:Uu.00g053000.m01.CDS01 [Anthostomella pinea]